MQDAELMKICQDAFDEAFEILYSDEDWKEEKKNDKGDLVVSRKTKTGESLTDNFHDYIIFKRKKIVRPSPTTR